MPVNDGRIARLLSKVHRRSASSGAARHAEAPAVICAAASSSANGENSPTTGLYWLNYDPYCTPRARASGTEEWGYAYSCDDLVSTSAVASSKSISTTTSSISTTREPTLSSHSSFSSGNSRMGSVSSRLPLGHSDSQPHDQTASLGGKSRPAHTGGLVLSHISPSGFPALHFASDLTWDIGWELQYPFKHGSAHDNQLSEPWRQEADELQLVDPTAPLGLGDSRAVPPSPNTSGITAKSSSSHPPSATALATSNSGSSARDTGRKSVPSRLRRSPVPERYLVSEAHASKLKPSDGPVHGLGLALSHTGLTSPRLPVVTLTPPIQPASPAIASSASSQRGAACSPHGSPSSEASTTPLAILRGSTTPLGFLQWSLPPLDSLAALPPAVDEAWL